MTAANAANAAGAMDATRYGSATNAPLRYTCPSRIAD
jgi:hypothetical protein